MTPQYQPVPIKICLCTLFPSRFVIRTKLPVYTSSNVLFSMYDMFTSFSFFVQSLRIFCDVGQCIFSVAHPSYETGVIILPLCYCVMINDEQRTSHFYNKLAGTENDLDHVPSTYVDSEHEITNFCHSQYVDMSEIHSIFQNVQIQL